MDVLVAASRPPAESPHPTRVSVEPVHVGLRKDARDGRLHGCWKARGTYVAEQEQLLCNHLHVDGQPGLISRRTCRTGKSVATTAPNVT